MVRQKIVGKLAFGLLSVALLNPYTIFAAAPSDACSLATPAQVSAVLGVQIGSGERVVSSSPNMCGFGGSSAAKRVVVSITTPEMFAHEKHALEGIKEEQATGLGDDAHYMTTPGFGTGLSVLKGAFAFKVRVYGFPTDQLKDKEKKLAQDILAKL
jgi:hypothetical protein